MPLRSNETSMRVNGERCRVGERSGVKLYRAHRPSPRIRAHRDCRAVGTQNAGAHSPMGDMMQKCTFSPGSQAPPAWEPHKKPMVWGWPRQQVLSLPGSGGQEASLGITVPLACGTGNQNHVARVTHGLVPSARRWGTMKCCPASHLRPPKGDAIQNAPFWGTCLPNGGGAPALKTPTRLPFSFHLFLQLPDALFLSRAPPESTQSP